MNKIYIGYDSKEQVVFDVCKYSIEKRHLSGKITIEALKQPQLRELGLYKRPIDQLASTEFSLTRFLTPYLSSYVGFSLFLDCDFIVLDDIQKLFDSIDKSKAVSVVKHDYQPSNKTKMNGLSQSIYPRKNWSSLMLFNNEHPSNKKLDLQTVNNETPQYLHRFSWLSDDQIGEISHSWNYLAGWYDDIERPMAIHYTEGGPWFKEHVDCDFAKEWLYEYYCMKEELSINKK
jgi:lipopolysaccharide biosynthesis glycosyltransferase